LDPDDTDTTSKEFKIFSSERSAEGLDPSIHNFRWLRKQATEAVVSGKIVIWNQPFTDNGILDRLIKFICEHADNSKLAVLVVEVDVNPQIAWQRVQQRNESRQQKLPREIFTKRVNEYKTFAGMGYKTISVNGQNAADKSVEVIIKSLKEV
jgi:thymidylate kinase